ncbi:MAG: YkgJ family cysteine cluster protein [Candidatus Omnitrophica bacterium]|jgi:Fe-S-cluster containining protein|nr:YkgJ family cysteine cluster protein [Candidatus Omnitrophota bacterium]MDD5518801.1 YkgJ family cysteine cluster protein [Candidatus Omnitrophota bacterium]
MKKIDCQKCKQQHSCCDFGAWVDLDEAKKILSLGLKGDFYHLEKDKDYPSGYRVGTSVEDNRCSFLTPGGLCSIHQVDYNFKPTHCKEFPYENGRLSSFADVLCPVVKSRRKSRKKQGSSR